MRQSVRIPEYIVITCAAFLLPCCWFIVTHVWFVAKWRVWSDSVLKAVQAGNKEMSLALLLLSPSLGKNNEPCYNYKQVTTLSLLTVTRILDRQQWSKRPATFSLLFAIISMIPRRTSNSRRYKNTYKATGLTPYWHSGLQHTPLFSHHLNASSFDSCRRIILILFLSSICLWRSTRPQSRLVPSFHAVGACCMALAFGLTVSFRLCEHSLRAQSIVDDCG